MSVWQSSLPLHSPVSVRLPSDHRRFYSSASVSKCTIYKACCSVNTHVVKRVLFLYYCQLTFIVLDQLKDSLGTSMTNIGQDRIRLGDV